MKLHHRFLKSLYSTYSISNYRLFGVGSTIIYVLSLTFLCMLPIIALFVGSLLHKSDGYGLSSFQNFGLNSEQMQEFASSVDGILPIILIVVYIAMYILFSGILFSGVSALSGISLPVSRILNKRLTYRHLWVMSCYSITLPVVLLTILFVMNVHVPYSFFLFWLLSGVMLVFAIYHTPAKK